jgi:small-conductance mechanosensitive channel
MNAAAGMQRAGMAETDMAKSLIQDIGAWLASHWLQIVIAFVIGALVYLALTGLRSLAARLCRLHGQESGLTQLFAQPLARTSHLFMLLVAARLVVSYANPPELVHDVVRFLFTVAAVFQVALWVREITLGLVDLRAGAENGHEGLANARNIIRLLVSVALFAIATIVVLDNVGVNVTGLIAGLGIGGIAIGLAAQGIFSDLFAALSILFDRPFKVGDTVHYDQTTGRVERIGLKSTRLRAVTGEHKIIGNARLLEKEITSYAELDFRRIKLPLALVYHMDPAILARLPSFLQSIVEEQGAKFVRAGIVNFGASSIDCEIEFDVISQDWEVVYETRHRVAIAILSHFSIEGITLAYPTQTTYTAAPDGRLVMPYPTPQPTQVKDSG